VKTRTERVVSKIAYLTGVPLSCDLSRDMRSVRHPLPRTFFLRDSSSSMASARRHCPPPHCRGDATVAPSLVHRHPPTSSTTTDDESPHETPNPNFTTAVDANPRPDKATAPPLRPHRPQLRHRSSPSPPQNLNP
jgi:hypothetical protein